MAKRIVYYAVDNGIDGMQEESILYASFDEGRLKAMHHKKPNKQWHTLKEKIVDVDGETKRALRKLNGIDKLLLGL